PRALLRAWGAGGRRLARQPGHGEGSRGVSVDMSTLDVLVQAQAELGGDGGRLGPFGQDPWWLVLVKAVLVFLVLVLLTLFNIWFERRVVGRMQHRIGPNVNGPFGLLQSLADGTKLMFKEDIFPKAADKVVYFLAPFIAV